MVKKLTELLTKHTVYYCMSLLKSLYVNYTVYYNCMRVKKKTNDCSFKFVYPLIVVCI